MVIPMPVAFCVRCKSTEISFKKLDGCKCDCGADFHFDKVCDACGSRTMIHRYAFKDDR